MCVCEHVSELKTPCLPVLPSQVSTVGDLSVPLLQLSRVFTAHGNCTVYMAGTTLSGKGFTAVGKEEEKEERSLLAAIAKYPG